MLWRFGATWKATIASRKRRQLPFRRFMSTRATSRPSEKRIGNHRRASMRPVIGRLCEWLVIRSLSAFVAACMVLRHESGFEVCSR